MAARREDVWTCRDARVVVGERMRCTRSTSGKGGERADTKGRGTRAVTRGSKFGKVIKL